MGRRLQLAHQASDNMFLKRAAQDDIEDTELGVMRRGLPKPADALLYDHGIPRQIVVRDDVSDLKIKIFGAGVGGNDDMNVGPMFTKARQRLLVLGTR